MGVGVGQGQELVEEGVQCQRGPPRLGGRVPPPAVTVVGRMFCEAATTDARRRAALIRSRPPL